MREINQAGIDIIKLAEGCKLTAYFCPAHKLTIGYGHTGPDVREGLTITPERAEELLREDLEWAETAVTHEVLVPLSDNQFSALVSFVFNVGIGSFAKSTLLKKLNAGDYRAVPGELIKWTRGGGKVLPGLIARRQSEIDLWFHG